MKKENFLIVKSTNLNRKKSISLFEIPKQNNNFLCVPDKKYFESNEYLSIEKNTIKRIESSTSLTIPDNFSFTEIEIQVYKIRWLLLILSILIISVSYMQWIQFSIITNIVMKYYNISSVAVDWTSMVFMVTYILLVFPISYFMDERGLRQTAIFGSVSLAIGSWIKLFSLHQEMFLFAFLGQTIVAVSQVFILSVPTRLGPIWFGPNEMSSVCGLGVFGSQLGIALGFFLTPLIVSDHDSIEDIHSGLQMLFFGNAIISSILVIFVAALFESNPKHPPSHVQAIQRSIKPSKKDYWNVAKRILSDNNFILLTLAYGINIGVFNGFSTLLNQIVLNYFNDGEQDAGNIGLVIIVTGLVGSILIGYIMDTTHKFKETSVFVCGLSAIGMLFFSLALESKSKILVYVTTIFLGLFMTAYQPIGYEFSSELTFPEPDGFSAGIMNISTHLFGIVITILISKVEHIYGDFFGNLCFTVLLLLGTVTTKLIKPDLKRYFAHKEVASAILELEKENDPTIITLKIDEFT